MARIQIRIIFEGHFIRIFEYSNIRAHHCKGLTKSDKLWKSLGQPGKTVPRDSFARLPPSQLSVNGVGHTKPLTTSLNPTSKHSSHLREPSKGGR